MQQRFGYIFILLLSALSLAAAYYFQIYDHLEPCILCIMQRICYYLLLITAIVALLHRPRAWGRYIYNTGLLIFSGLGIYYAGRQVWLQHLPAGQAGSCPPSFSFLVENFPLADVLRFLFYGAADCAKVSWRLFSFSMAEWSIAIFALSFLVGVFLVINLMRRG